MKFGIELSESEAIPGDDRLILSVPSRNRLVSIATATRALV